MTEDRMQITYYETGNPVMPYAVTIGRTYVAGVQSAARAEEIVEEYERMRSTATCFVGGVSCEASKLWRLYHSEYSYLFLNAREMARLRRVLEGSTGILSGYQSRQR